MKNIKLKTVVGIFIIHIALLGASPESFKTEEYSAMGGLDLINAAEAYAQGYTGKGVTVGVVDYFMNLNHSEFKDKNNSFVVGEQGGTLTGGNLWESHGNWIGGIIAASKDNQGIHGVAFNSNIVSGEGAFDLSYGDVVSDLENMKRVYSYLNSQKDIKIIHNGWVNYKYYLDELHRNEMYGKTYQGIEGLRKLITEKEDFERDLVVESVTKYNKLLVFPNGNNGHISSNMPSMIPYINPETRFNIIGVASLDVYSKGEDEDIFVSTFSDLNKYNEENSLSSYGAKLYSSTLDGYIKTWGTSAAAPLVTGTGLLVQEAFPYLNGKQIGDVLLSTADKEKYKSEGKEYVLTTEQTFKDGSWGEGKINIIAFNDTELDMKTIKGYVLDYFEKKKDYFIEITGREDLTSGEEMWKWIVEKGYLQVYNDVPYEIVYGQGIVDAGKAVKGLGALNGRRLTKNDRSDMIDRVKNLGLDKQGVYSVDTMGFDSVWSNEIGEIKAGYMIASNKDSFNETVKKLEVLGIDNEKIEELKKYLGKNNVNDTDKEYFDKMFDFYLSGKYVYDKEKKELVESPENKKLIENGLEYILEYNKRVEESGLVGLSVGLFKEGEGTLSLAAKNSYEGATIAGGGTLQIDGSVAGNVYSISDIKGTGTIAGSGTIKKNLYNYGKIQGGSWGDTGTLKVEGELYSKGGTIVVNVSGDKNSSIQVGKIAEFENTKIEINGIARPDTVYKEFLKGETEGVAVDVKGDISLFLGYETQSTDKKSYDLKVEKTARLDSLKNMSKEQKETASILEEMYTENPQEKELYLFYNIKDEKTALKTYQEVYGGLHSDMRMNLPLNNLHSVVYSKADSRFFKGNENEIIEAGDIWTSILTERKDIKGSRGMDSLDINMKGFVLGSDSGYFIAYGENEIKGDKNKGEIRDIRTGMYGKHKTGKFELSGYTAVGIQKNETERELAILGKKAKSEYDSWTVEGGLKGKYSLSESIRPYGELNIVRYENEAIKEKGAGILSQRIRKGKDVYSTAGAGIEFVRETADIRGLLQLGYEKVLFGKDFEMNASFSGSSREFKLRGHSYAEDYFVIKTGVEKKLRGGVVIYGEGEGRLSSKDKEYSVNLGVKYSL